MTPFEREWEHARHAHSLQQLKRESKANRQAEQAQIAAQKPDREPSRHLLKRQPALSLNQQPSDHHA